MQAAVVRTPQSAGRSQAVAASGLAAERATSPALRLLVGTVLALALLALLLALTPSMLPGQLGVLVDERRESLIVGGGLCILGVGLGLLIALMGS